MLSEFVAALAFIAPPPQPPASFGVAQLKLKT